MQPASSGDSLPPPGHEVDDGYGHAGERQGGDFAGHLAGAELRATLIYVKSVTNVTLSLPDALLRKFRIYAATRNQSMTSLAAQAIRDLMEREQQTATAKRRFLERIRNAPDRGTGGAIRWTRDELHER